MLYGIVFEACEGADQARLAVFGLAVAADCWVGLLFGTVCRIALGVLI